jgi:hypothetical protein
MNDTENKLCPSSTCREGSLLLGVVMPDKTVSILNTPLRTDKAFIDKVQAQGEPEKRFRFANKCAKSGCRQWDGSSCGVMNTLAAANRQLEEETVLRPCFIRDSCRWFHQEGKTACAICPFVITNNMEETVG